MISFDYPPIFLILAILGAFIGGLFLFFNIIKLLIDTVNDLKGVRNK